VPPPATCDRNEVRLELSFHLDGLPDSQLVPVRTRKGEGWLAIDTGSARTFVYGPTSLTTQPITVGCEQLDVISRDFEAEDFGGKPILGVLGADFFLEHDSDFDYPGRKIVRHRAGSRVGGVEGYASVPLTQAGGHLAMHAQVDGTSRLLMFDTGSPHLLLVPVDGRPGDKPTQVQDASGAVVDAWEGDSDVVFAAESRRVPTLRIPKWPYFEGYQKDLHPELAGLLGLSTMGFRRIVFDKAANVVRLGPITKP
jgi:hypothetical protein